MKQVKVRSLVPFMSVVLTVFVGALCILLEAPYWFVAVAAIVTLTPLFLARWGAWREEGSRWGGVFLLFPAFYVIAYSLGSVPIGTQGPLGVRADAGQWILYFVGIVAYFIGAAFFVNRAPLRPEGVAPRRASRTVGMLAGVAGLAGAAINYATGGIPLLAENVNAGRFGENQSLLGPLTGFIVGAEQVSLVVLTLSWYSSRKNGLREPTSTKLMILVLIVSLVLSGARGFLVLPLVAIAFAIAEFNLVKPLTFLLIAVLGFSGLTAYNQYRQQESGTIEALNAALEANGVADVPLASGLLGLQIGPAVMQVSRTMIPDRIPFQGGTFFLNDGGVLVGSDHNSDYFTTVVVTNRNYNAVGGSPPTILGGFYIDGGVPLVIIGMIALGLISRFMRNGYFRNPHIYSGAAYGYWCAWIVLSLYGYISLKPAALTVFVVALVGSMAVNASETRATRIAQEVARRSRLRHR